MGKLRQVRDRALAERSRLFERTAAAAGRVTKGICQSAAAIVQGNSRIAQADAHVSYAASSRLRQQSATHIIN